MTLSFVPEADQASTSQGVAGGGAGLALRGAWGMAQQAGDEGPVLVMVVVLALVRALWPVPPYVVDRLYLLGRLR